jgi:hypothetical protein
MKNAEQAGCRQRFRDPRRCFDGWDKITGWILSLLLVLGGTQVYLAQYSYDKQATSVRQKKSQTTPLHDDSQSPHKNATPERKFLDFSNMPLINSGA